MEKQQLKSFLEGQISTGSITKDDLASVLSEIGVNLPNSIVSSPVTTHNEESSKKLTSIFYAIGAIIAVVGVGILIGQNWEEIGFLGRILVSLGIALVTYVSGLLLRDPEQKNISQVMFTVSAALAPLGSYVLLKEAGVVDFGFFTQEVVAAVLLIIFGGALLISRKNILVIISVGFASWLYYTFILNSFGFDAHYQNADILKWATMFLGASYVLIAYGYRSFWSDLDDVASKKERSAVSSVLYSFGTLAVLGSGVSIGGYFDLIFIAFIFGTFYGGVYLKSRIMLILAALFLMAHIIKLTSKYFIDSIGWPVALIIMGFVVIGIGYITFYLNKKFLSAR